MQVCRAEQMISLAAKGQGPCGIHPCNSIRYETTFKETCDLSKSCQLVSNILMKEEILHAAFTLLGEYGITNSSNTMSLNNTFIKR